MSPNSRQPCEIPPIIGQWSFSICDPIWQNKSKVTFWQTMLGPLKAQTFMQRHELFDLELIPKIARKSLNNKGSARYEPEQGPCSL